MAARKKSKIKRIKLSTPKRNNKFALLFVVLLVAAVGVKLLLNGLAATSSFTYLATHPQAAQQPTALGKTLQTLIAWNGKIYAGYGDYGANTGPIAITPFDPQTNTFSSTPELSDDLTEAIQLFRSINGKLYAPSTDPRYGYSTDYAVGTPSGASAIWSQIGTIKTAHAFDMVTLTGSDLWLVGSSYGDIHPGAWRSLDGGATWQNVLDVAPPSAEYDNNRFYFAGVYGGKLYVQGYFWASSTGATYIEPNSHVFDGSSWSKGPNLLPYGGMGYHTENFAGKLVYLLWQGTPSATRLTVFDGSKVSLSSAPSAFWEYVVDNGVLYGLGSDGAIYSTKDLTTWYKSATAPSTARSIAILNGQIYIGTTDSKIYSAPIVSDPTLVSGTTSTTKVHGGGKGTTGGPPGHN